VEFDGMERNKIGIVNWKPKYDLPNWRKEK